MLFVPSWKHKLELGPRANGMARYNFSNGMAFLPDFAGGLCLPQVYCRPVFRPTKGETPALRFTDDVLLNSPRQNALLRLLVVVDNMKQAEEAWSELQGLEIESASRGEVSARTAMFLIHDPFLEIHEPKTQSNIPLENVYRVATGDEFAATDLCKNRPYPKGYDVYRIKKDVGGRKYLLIRPDRFLYAACDNTAQLRSACERIPATMLGESDAKL